MMSERLPRLSFVAASLSLLLMLAAVGMLVVWQTPNPIALVAVLPPVWLLVASLCNLDEPGHAAYGVTTAALLCLPLNAWLAMEVGGHWTGWRFMPPMPLGWIEAVLVQFPVALVALVPSALGWWQRRQDRLAADANA